MSPGRWLQATPGAGGQPAAEPHVALFARAIGRQPSPIRASSRGSAARFAAEIVAMRSERHLERAGFAAVKNRRTGRRATCKAVSDGRVWDSLEGRWRQSLLAVVLYRQGLLLGRASRKATLSRRPLHCSTVAGVKPRSSRIQVT